jgi:RimJ/RimL family protein N-acetyltransferase
MTKKDKIAYAMNCKTTEWSCPEDTFHKRENVFLETNKTFWGIMTFGYNALIVADKQIIDWCAETFSGIPACEILDIGYLYLIQQKLREHGKKLDGENTRYLHLYPDREVEKPQGFTFELYEKDRVSELYDMNYRFDNALNYDAKGEVLAIIAKDAKDEEKIAAIAGADDYHAGLWQMGIDTVDKYRGKGLAAYLVKEMALESERRNQVPFYTTWHSNIASTRTALSAGFSPVWVDYFAEDV